MKRLLIYCPQLMPSGGIESHIKEFCRHLASDDVEIHLVVANYRFSKQDHEDLEHSCHKVHVCKSSSSIVRKTWLLATLTRLRFLYFDALYTNGQGNTISLVSKMIASRGRWVHHHHTSGDEEDRATWPSSYRVAIARADRLIACSQRNADDIERAVSIKTDTIPCFSRDVGKYPLSTKASADQWRFGYFGRFIREKGIELICQLSESPQLEDIQFHLWGSESKQYNREYFHRYSRVHYHGAFRTEFELREVVSRLDAFVLLSTHPEGLPISLLEVLSAGVPWIATDRGGVVDIACDPTATIVLPSTPSYEDSHAAIRSLADDLKANKIPREKLRALYLSRYSANAVSRRWFEELFLCNTK